MKFRRRKYDYNSDLHDSLIATIGELTAQLDRAYARADGFEATVNQLAHDRAVRDALLADMFDGKFVDGGDPDYPECAVVYYELPSGQVSAHYYPSEFELFDNLPHVPFYEWDGHTKEEAEERFKEFGNFTKIIATGPLEELGSLTDEVIAKVRELTKETEDAASSSGE